ncbi:hypothetical protein JAAARDRAFT_437924 [Jaapia argillacea MUCL 33604]|uniref:Uncharacterized protein n=1 Tax=Jaapia argillacea MUCL 33604 TaxID=933084 RepID=A0A067PS97_9AGAM|nr:hypothetical protein JAAARDRAFT_437924 [Jaapia argillacea MUCL 33604]
MNHISFISPQFPAGHGLRTKLPTRLPHRLYQSSSLGLARLFCVFSFASLHCLFIPGDPPHPLFALSFVVPFLYSLPQVPLTQINNNCAVACFHLRGQQNTNPLGNIMVFACRSNPGARIDSFVRPSESISRAM